ncbi:hypothetical protein SSTU70S_06954 [Stutzerimonas stutzeri]
MQKNETPPGWGGVSYVAIRRCVTARVAQCQSQCRAGETRRYQVGATPNVSKAAANFSLCWPCFVDAEKQNPASWGGVSYVVVRRCVTARVAWCQSQCRAGETRRYEVGATQNVSKAAADFRCVGHVSSMQKNETPPGWGGVSYVAIRRCVTARVARSESKRRAGETRRYQVGATPNVRDVGRVKPADIRSARRETSSRQQAIFVMIGHVPSMPRKNKTPPVRAGFWVPVRRCVTARVSPALQGLGGWATAWSQIVLTNMAVSNRAAPCSIYIA